ncbi:MAG TPA: beta-L-arabinofuranosidase domain-containing protein [Candidatus Solibacter sp.]
MLSRRGFLQTVTAGAAAGTLPAASRENLREFGHSDVVLTGGPLKQQYDWVHAHFLSLDNDRLLKVYRQRAGLPAPGDDMGGWYDADGFVPGHTLGQYISGLSRIYATTRAAATRAKVQQLVMGYAATLRDDGYPYASEKAAVTWPCYILDKYVVGMLDANRLAGVPAARDLLPRVIRGAIPQIPDHTYDRGPDSPKQAPYDEPYILPENLFHSYELTGDRQFLDMARLYLLNQEYFDPLAQGRNLLPGKHAYSHVIALSSAAKAYEVLGDAKYLNAIRNAWDMLEETQQFASGGWGPKEAFVPPHEGKLGEFLTTTREHFETPCGCYAHMKLARYLLRFTADPRYGDGLERVLYNTILGSIEPTENGDYFYYSDYQSGARKGYYKKKWPCCSGTLVQGVADYATSIYFQDSGGIYVNLFAPSEVRWKNARLIQDTRYPHADSVHLRVDVPKPVEFAIHVRIPAWLSAPASIAVNGKSFDVAASPGTFAAIRRRWSANDTVDVKLPWRDRTQPIDDRHPDTVALMRGPLMMVSLEAPLGAPPIWEPFYSVRAQTYTTYFRKLPSRDR